LLDTDADEENACDFYTHMYGVTLTVQLQLTSIFLKFLHKIEFV